MSQVDKVPLDTTNIEAHDEIGVHATTSRTEHRRNGNAKDLMTHENKKVVRVQYNFFCFDQLIYTLSFHSAVPTLVIPT